eukprot:3363984-Rhodomonas_salina.1
MRRDGVGLRTSKGDVWSALFEDDIATPSNLDGGVQHGLDLCRQFGKWAGISLNVAECEATGYNYATGKPLGTDRLHIDGEMLCPLQQTKPFKYLGCRTTLTLSWRAENEAVLQRTSAEIKIIRMGFLGTQATRAVIDMA